MCAGWSAKSRGARRSPEGTEGRCGVVLGEAEVSLGTAQSPIAIAQRVAIASRHRCWCERLVTVGTWAGSAGISADGLPQQEGGHAGRTSSQRSAVSAAGLGCLRGGLPLRPGCQSDSYLSCQQPECLSGRAASAAKLPQQRGCLSNRAAYTARLPQRQSSLSGRAA